jgi:hypothetical protein
MTDGTTEPKFAYKHEGAARPGVEQTLPGKARERVETKPEQAQEQASEHATDKKTTDFFGVLKRRKPKVTNIPQVRDEMTVRIEKILEDRVGDAYNRLSPVQKQEFKLKGEETARKVRELLNDTHVKIKKIFRLILEWLKMLPGVNRFFLEQEAKIKTDRLLALAQRHHDTH